LRERQHDADNRALTATEESHDAANPALADLHDLHPNELRQRFVVLDDKIERVLAKAEKSGLTDGERRQLDELDAESGQVGELIQTKERNKPKTGPIKPMATTQVGNEEHTYRPDGRESYFRDLVLTQFRGDCDARDRLHRHKEEIETTQPEFRDLNRTDTTGGEFVPPIWVDRRLRRCTPSRSHDRESRDQPAATRRHGLDQHPEDQHRRER
jgi:hypothetical protein